ncbi:MAG: hypothetical protein QOE24_3044 [Frankiales bacterium]|nr:hypothetical protein [Frankiales bacterium]
MPLQTPSVLTLDAAVAAGYSRDAVKYRASRGDWQRVFPRVYATYSGPVHAEDRLQAALCYAGAGAALSHQTAAVRLRLPIAPAKTLHLVVPADRRVASQDGLSLHYSRDLPASDVRSVRGLACTSVERTVLDLVRNAASPGRAAGIIADAVGSRRTTSARIRALVEHRAAVPYRADVLDVLAQTQEGCHSALELRHAGVCRGHALPLGTRQLRQLLGGKVTYADNVVEEFEVYTELDGRLGHELEDDVFRDHRRDNANTVAGRSVLRIGWRSVLDEPCEVARERAGTLRRRGWTGSARECGPTCTVNLPYEEVVERQGAHRPPSSQQAP